MVKMDELVRKDPQLGLDTKHQYAADWLIDRYKVLDAVGQGKARIYRYCVGNHQNLTDKGRARS